MRSPFLFCKSVVPWSLDDNSDANLQRYVYDIEATENALTKDGFFKTGDVAEKHGQNYYIKGRKSIDSELDRLGR